MVVRGSAWEAASCTSRSGTPASRAAVMNACRRVCGPAGLAIPARRATRRTIRPAPCRSSQPPWADRKIGPSERSPMARSIARGARCERDGDNLAALAGDHQSPVPALDAQGLDVGTGSFGHAQPVERQQGDQRMLGGLTEPGGNEQRTQLVAVQPGGYRLIIQPGTADMRGQGLIQQVFLHRVPVEPATVHSRRVIVARARPWASRSRAKHSMSARRAWNRRNWRRWHQLAYWRRSKAYASRVKPV